MSSLYVNEINIYVVKKRYPFGTSAVKRLFHFRIEVSRLSLLKWIKYLIYNYF